MNRLLAVFLCFVLLCSTGCTLSGNQPSPSGSDGTTPNAQTEEPSDAPIAEPTETPYAPDLSMLPITYNVYEQVGWNVSEATMFRYDVDFDGETEDISFRLDPENDRTIISVGSDRIELDGVDLVQAMLIDLDPGTPYVNLLVSIDEASDDYITTELHLSNGKIVKGAVVYDACYWDEERQKLMFFERSDMLGTKEGIRSYSGEDLVPDTDWIELCFIPTQEDIENRRDDLIEIGDLLHTIREVPCEINGLPAKIAGNAYLYMRGFSGARDVAEVCTEDGITAIVHMAMLDTDDFWGYTIDGVPVTAYFDNLFFAD